MSLFCDKCGGFYGHASDCPRAPTLVPRTLESPPVSELADEIERTLHAALKKDQDTFWFQFSCEGAAKLIAALRQRAPEIPEGLVLVPEDIHPMDNSKGDAVINLLRTPPSAARFNDPNAYYDYWWSLLLAAAKGEKP